MPGPAPPDSFSKLAREATLSFAQFVAERSASLLRAAWLLTGDEGKAEDLLQTVLTRVWPHWSRVEAGGNPEGYVRRALYTTYLTWWRRRWRMEVPAAAPQERADRADLAGAHATRDAVIRALVGLSRQQRAVVVLRYAEDRSVAETAEVLGCSPDTVKVQAARALARLRVNPHLRDDTVAPVKGVAEHD